MTQRPTEDAQPITMQSLRDRQRQERDELIIQAACEVFIEKGYHNASIDEIAARTGIAKGTVYRYYDSKEKLVIAIVEKHINESLSFIDLVCHEGGTIRSRLEKILERSYTGIQQERILLPQAIGSIGFAKEAVLKHPDLEKRIGEVRKRIEGIFEEGIKSNEFLSPIPTNVLAATFIGLLSLDGFEELLTQGKMSPRDLVSLVSLLFFASLQHPQSQA